MPHQNDLVVIDEAHRSMATTYRRIIGAYPKAVVLGLTATPCRSDGKGLGGSLFCEGDCRRVMPGVPSTKGTLST